MGHAVMILKVEGRFGLAPQTIVVLLLVFEPVLATMLRDFITFDIE